MHGREFFPENHVDAFARGLNTTDCKVRNHYTTRKHYYPHRMTFGGVHEDPQKAMKFLMREIGKDLGYYGEESLDFSVVLIEENEEYTPHGAGGEPLVHGVNDGFHGAPFIPPSPNLGKLLRSILDENS